MKDTEGGETLATTYERQIKKAMVSVGTWKPEYRQAVTLCAELMRQYDELNALYIRQGMPYYETTSDGGSKKSPLVSTLESLRRDILAYLKELGLTPMSLKRMDAVAERSQSTVLADALRKLGE